MNTTHTLTKQKAEQQVPVEDSVDNSSGIEPTIFDLPQDEAEGDLLLMHPEHQYEEDHWIVKGD